MTQNTGNASLQLPSKLKWYKEGLKFKCTGCGLCCTGAPGYVWLSDEEITAMAAHFNLKREIFLKTYARKVGLRYSLREMEPSYDCIFLKNNQCSIYALRPLQCRTFPWWPENLKSSKSWKETRQNCEGIDHPQAILISSEEIERNLEQK